MRLKNQVAIVTGGASGIGEATATRYCKEGAKVIVVDIVEEAGKAVAEHLIDQGYEATFMRVDVTSETDWTELISFVDKKYGCLDIVFNNAGSNFHKNIIDHSLADWTDLLNLNLTGVFLGCKHSLPLMLEGNGGVIVNNASSLGIITMPEMPAYSASKGGIIALTRQIALDYANKGIRVNCVCPGPVMTPRIQRTIQSGKGDPETILAEVPMGRFADPSEIASVVAFLSSDDASFMTGAAIVIDGGQTIH